MVRPSCATMQSISTADQRECAERRCPRGRLSAGNRAPQGRDPFRPCQHPPLRRGAETAAWDLVGQAEHGVDSPVWLVTTDQDLAAKVIASVSALIDSLPDPNRTAARTAWHERAEVVLCDSREEAAQVADRYAPEHLQIQSEDLEWWLDPLSA